MISDLLFPTPFVVAATPVTIVLCLFKLISFGFYVAMNAVTPIWLQKPKKIGGYGFTSQQNAYCKQKPWVLFEQKLKNYNSLLHSLDRNLICLGVWLAGQ
jgi:hypothetical protein